jgi:hypothetical protein
MDKAVAHTIGWLQLRLAYLKTAIEEHRIGYCFESLSKTGWRGQQRKGGAGVVIQKC